WAASTAASMCGGHSRHSHTAATSSSRWSSSRRGWASGPSSADSDKLDGNASVSRRSGSQPRARRAPATRSVQNGSPPCDNSSMVDASFIGSPRGSRVRGGRVLVAVVEPSRRLVVVARVLLGALAIEAVVGRRWAAAARSGHAGGIAIRAQQMSEERRGRFALLLVVLLVGHVVVSLGL